MIGARRHYGAIHNAEQRVDSSMTTANGRPTIAEIDLGALRANYRALSAYTNGAAIMAVVKADAYGHGAVEVARTLRIEGCAHFGVATVE